MKTSAVAKSYHRLMMLVYYFVSIIITANTATAQIMGDTAHVGEGWNMIGSPLDGLVAQVVRSEPVGIIVSSFYGYNPGGGYQAKDTLKKNTAYWVKVSENGKIIFGIGEWTCGNPIVYEGDTYSTVQIGSQCWLKENLRVGIRINVSQISSNNGVIEKYCYYNDPVNCDVYGGLYQWDEAMQYVTTPGTRGICPSGWHIPTQGDFELLSATVAANGNALKAAGQGSGDGLGTNTSGFSALLAGTCTPPSGGSSGLWSQTRIWGSLEGSVSYTYVVLLTSMNNTFFLGYTIRSTGNSIRCLKD